MRTTICPGISRRAAHGPGQSVERDPGARGHEPLQSQAHARLIELSGEFLSIDKTEFKSASGAMLPAKRFTFGSDKV